MEVKLGHQDSFLIAKTHKLFAALGLYVVCSMSSPAAIWWCVGVGVHNKGH